MTIYTINFTDPRRDEFVVNPYTANGLKFPTLPVLETGASTARTSLLWYGKGSPNYGERIQENVLHLMEHFAGPTAPAHPVAGQLWFDRRIFFHTSATANANWYVWVDDPADPNGGTWSSLSMVGRTGAVGSRPAVDAGGAEYQYWFDNTTSTFYQGLNSSGHPLHLSWSVCGYMEDTSIGGAPSAATYKPQQRLMVQTYGRTALADDVNWQLANGVWASPMQPVDPTDGTLWYDTTTQALKVYNSAGSPPGFEAVVGSFLPLGGGTMTGQIDMGTFRIVNLGTPIISTDAATKGYVDAALTSTIELNELTDVGITGPSVRQVLMYTGGSPILWENQSLILSDISDVTATAAQVNFLGGGTPVTSSVQLQLDGKLSLTGGNMTGNIVMNNNLITSLGTPVAGTDATTKAYVDGRDIIGGSFDAGLGELTLNRGTEPAFVISGFLSASGLTYAALPSELLGQLPPAVVPDNVDSALHNLDNIIRRRTTPRRVVDIGVGGSPPQLTYTTPYYEVGSHKLFVFVDGLKYVASSPGYQSVLFNPNAIGSPLAPPYQLSCDVDPVLPGGGSPAFDYQFDVSVDGGGPQTITVNGGTNEADTFCSVVDAINAQIVGATAVLEDTAITIYSNSTGAGSSIAITDGSVGSPILPLFASMAYFDVIDAAVPGADFDYVENGDVGDITNTITFTAPVTGATLEFVVIGQSGTTLV